MRFAPLGASREEAAELEKLVEDWIARYEGEPVDSAGDEEEAGQTLLLCKFFL